MKTIKRVSLLLVAALAALCMGVFASACSAKEFTITVYYSDGVTAVDGTSTGYTTQICYYDTDKKELVNCYNSEGSEGAIDKDGKSIFSIANVDAKKPAGNIKYEVHVWAPDAVDSEELKESVYVSSSNSSVKVVLKNVDAPAK